MAKILYSSRLVSLFRATLVGLGIWTLFMGVGKGQGSVYLEPQVDTVDIGIPLKINVGVEPGSEDILSLALYLKYDPSILRLVSFQSDPNEVLELEILSHSDTAQGTIAFEAGTLAPLKDSLQAISLEFIPISPTDKSRIEFQFSDEGPGTALMNSRVESILDSAQARHYHFSVGCKHASTQAGQDQSICGNSTLLQAVSPLEGVGRWVIAEGTGGVLEDAEDPQSRFTGVPGSRYSLAWHVASETCIPRPDTVQIQFDKEPDLANAGDDIFACSQAINLGANAPKNGLGYWKKLQGPGGSFSDSLSPASLFYGEVGAAYLLTWTIESGSCGIQVDTLAVTLLSGVEYADAGKDQQVCGTETLLNAVVPEAISGHWEIIQGTGGSLEDVQNPNSLFSGTVGNHYTLRWKLLYPGCESYDEVDIHLVAKPSEADAGTDQYVCDSLTQLFAQVPAVGNGTWEIIAGEGGSLADPTDPQSSFRGKLGNSYVLRWIVSNEAVCGSSQDEVFLEFAQNSLKSIAGPDQVIFGDLVFLEARSIDSTQKGKGIWRILTGDGKGILNDPIDPVSGFIGTPGQSYTLEWQDASGACIATPDTVVLHFQPLPRAFAGQDQKIAGEKNTLLNASPPPPFLTGFWEIANGKAGRIKDKQNPNSVFEGVPGKHYLLVWSLAHEGQILAADTVHIDFLPKLPAPACSIRTYALCQAPEALENRGKLQRAALLELPLPTDFFAQHTTPKAPETWYWDASSTFVQKTDSTGTLRGVLRNPWINHTVFDAFIELYYPPNSLHIGFRESSENISSFSPTQNGWQLTGTSLLVAKGAIRGVLELKADSTQTYPYPPLTLSSPFIATGYLQAAGNSYQVHQGGKLFVDVGPCEEICGISTTPPLLYNLVGTYSEESVFLEWNSQSVSGEEELLLERSAENQTFVPVAVIPANYQSQGRYLDRDVYPHTRYIYRIRSTYHKKIDIISDSVSVFTSQHKGDNVRIISNPVVSRSIQVFVGAGNMGKWRYQIYSINGQKLTEGNIYQSGYHQLRLENRISGLIVVYFRSETGDQSSFLLEILGN